MILKKGILPVSIISLISTLCLFDNKAGITIPLFAIMFELFLVYICKREDYSIGKIIYVYGIIAGILSMTIAMTSNGFIQIMSKLLFCLLVDVSIIMVYYKIDSLDAVTQIVNILFYKISSFTSIFDLKKDISECKSDVTGEINEERKNIWMQILKGVIIAIPVLIIVLILLGSADAAVRSIFEKVINGVTNLEMFVRAALFFIVSALILYGIVKSLSKKCIYTENISINKLNVITGITFGSIMAFVYSVFCIIRIVAVISNGELMLPAGYTYARYAREGFFQLMLVCIINVMLVFISRVKFDFNDILKRILLIICVCTYFMTISAGYRMLLYIKAYNLTILRVFVMWSLVTVLIIMSLIVKYIIDDKFNLFKYGLLVFSIMYMIIALVRPDYLVAWYNVNIANVNTADMECMIDDLSDDCIPVILKCSEKYDDSVKLENQCRKIVLSYSENSDIRKFNISQYISYKYALRYLD